MIHERPKSFGAGLARLMGLEGMGLGGGPQTGTHAPGVLGGHPQLLGPASSALSLRWH